MWSLNLINDPFGVRLLNRLCFYFSHFREYKFRNNFGGSLNPLYVHTLMKLEIQSIPLFFLHCQNNLSFCTTFMNDLTNINNAIASLNPSGLARVFFYGDKSFSKKLIVRY